jgi:thioredoxin-dependent peroxiredoxin
MKLIRAYQIISVALAISFTFKLSAADAPNVGEKAPDFVLKTVDQKSVRLAELTAKSSVVLLVLRGWPGYQCPLCTAQVQDYIGSSEQFSKTKARVVMVYPGPSDHLKARAQEFLESKQWPKDFIFVMDPDYAMVNAYGLRWDAPNETAYPATFVLDRKGIVRFAKISHTHGDRTKAMDITKALRQIRDE